LIPLTLMELIETQQHRDTKRSDGHDDQRPHRKYMIRPGRVRP